MVLNPFLFVFLCLFCFCVPYPHAYMYNPGCTSVAQCVCVCMCVWVWVGVGVGVQYHVFGCHGTVWCSCNQCVSHRLCVCTYTCTHVHCCTCVYQCVPDTRYLVCVFSQSHPMVLVLMEQCGVHATISCIGVCVRTCVYVSWIEIDSPARCNLGANSNLGTTLLILPWIRPYQP